MILQPAIMALLLGSLLVSLMMLYSARYGVGIVRLWDLQNGSESQLQFEKRTYLVSTIITYAFGFQLASLLLFIFTSDNLSTLFVGAMCAAGTLNVNRFGYPALLLKIINFLLAGLWLVLNYVDNKASDYPLIRKKYLLLLGIVPFILAEAVLQGSFLLNLKPNIITSCCGSLFGQENAGLGAAFTSLPTVPLVIAYYSAMGLTAASGIIFYIKGRPAAGILFSLMAVITFIVSIASLISFISPYFYALPTHHCPFCILQKEYYYVGYPLYISLLGALITGSGVGVLMPFRHIGSLKDFIPRIQKQFALSALILYSVFFVISAGVMLFTDFRYSGY